MNDITVVDATVADKELLAKTFQHFKDKNTIKNRAECYLSHNHTTLAKDRNQIIGKMLWYVKENPNDGVVEFEELYVFEEYRRKGIGTELVKYSIKAVRKHFNNLEIDPRRIYLFTSEKNQIARRLYQKFGFKYIANLGHLYSENENELFYMLDLSKFE